MSCPICESPHAADVDAALRRGSGHKALALVAAAVAALEQRLSEVAAELSPPSFPVPLADVLAARDAMRANTEGAYARARDTGAHGEGVHGWT